MGEVYVRTGTLREGRSVSLDQSLPLNAGRVRVTIEPVAASDTPTDQLEDVLDQIWEGQRARHHCPPAASAVVEQIAIERAAWR